MEGVPGPDLNGVTTKGINKNIFFFLQEFILARNVENIHLYAANIPFKCIALIDLR